MADNSGDTFTALVRRCRNNDRQAWQRLIDLISPYIFSICRNMKLSREESFDVYGQVCYRLLTGIHKLRTPAKLLAYVGTVTPSRETPASC